MIPNIFFLDIIIVFEVTNIWHPQKMASKWPSQFNHPQKLAIDLFFKIMESGNTWQILRTPLLTPLLCRHKCMFAFRFFKVWSVTCLNVNEIFNFMKIHKLSSVKLSKKPSKLIFPTISVTFWTTFWKVYISNHHICLPFVTKFCFWNVIVGNGKL